MFEKGQVLYYGPNREKCFYIRPLRQFFMPPAELVELDDEIGSELTVQAHELSLTPKE